MNFLSIFDVIGPNMIGPSSSHTAGACAIGLMVLFLKHTMDMEQTVHFLAVFLASLQMMNEFVMHLNLQKNGALNTNLSSMRKRL